MLTSLQEEYFKKGESEFLIENNLSDELITMLKHIKKIWPTARYENNNNKRIKKYTNEQMDTSADLFDKVQDFMIGQCKSRKQTQISS